jgi:hypothetical protein
MAIFFRGHGWKHHPLSRTPIQQVALRLFRLLAIRGSSQPKKSDLGSTQHFGPVNNSINDRLQALLLETGNLRAQLANTEGAADCYLQLCLAMDHIRNARNLTHKLNERL